MPESDGLLSWLSALTTCTWVKIRSSLFNQPQALSIRNGLRIKIWLSGYTLDGGRWWYIGHNPFLSGDTPRVYFFPTLRVKWPPLHKLLGKSTGLINYHRQQPHTQVLSSLMLALMCKSYASTRQHIFSSARGSLVSEPDPLHREEGSGHVPTSE